MHHTQIILLHTHTLKRDQSPNRYAANPEGRSALPLIRVRPSTRGWCVGGPVRGGITESLLQGCALTVVCRPIAEGITCTFRSKYPQELCVESDLDSFLCPLAEQELRGREAIGSGRGLLIFAAWCERSKRAG
jgi:hypothetical protein